MESSENVVGATELEELDVEIFAKERPGCEKPQSNVYVIRIDRERKRVHEPTSSGAAILELVGKTEDTHKLFRKLCDGQTKVVERNELICILDAEFERFQTIPKDTTEGGGYE